MVNEIDEIFSSSSSKLPTKTNGHDATRRMDVDARSVGSAVTSSLSSKGKNKRKRKRKDLETEVRIESTHVEEEEEWGGIDSARLQTDTTKVDESESSKAFDNTIKWEVEVVDASMPVRQSLPKYPNRSITSSSSSKKQSSKADDEDEIFKDSRGSGPRRKTEEGYRIFKEDELGINDAGGDTPDCPFDCNCCF